MKNKLKSVECVRLQHDLISTIKHIIGDFYEWRTITVTYLPEIDLSRLNLNFTDISKFEIDILAVLNKRGFEVIKTDLITYRTTFRKRNYFHFKRK